MTIGIVGAGQLGRMMALAGYPLGLDFLFLDKSPDTPGGQVAPSLCGEFTDAKLLEALAERAAVVTIDWENVPVAALRPVAKQTRVFPPLRALAAAQDRLTEKRTFEKLGIPTTRYAAVDTFAQLEKAVQRIGSPGVLKTRRLGYDGKGQFVIRSASDVGAAWGALNGAALLYENFVPFSDEISVIGVRSRRGEVAVYPLNRNFHRDGILRLTRAPFGSRALERAARRYIHRVLEHFSYVGVLTIEFFASNGRLVANEMAPRVHNSGHWTIEGAETSQFENHIRAIAGLPLGSTRARGHSAMINLIGSVPPAAALLAEPGVHLHDYGKEPRNGRKVGHVTVVERTAAARDRRAGILLQTIDRESRVTLRRG